MHRPSGLGVALAGVLSAAAFQSASAADCTTVSPRQWIGGTCAVADLRASLARRMDASTREVMSETCASASPDRWLVGTWRLEKSNLTIEKGDGGYVWDFDRKAGQTSQTWGEKDPARAKGRVVSVKGCTVELDGAYTAFEGRGASGRNPIGWPMKYTLDLVAPSYLAGTGLGYGQKPYRVFFSKD